MQGQGLPEPRIRPELSVQQIACARDQTASEHSRRTLLPALAGYDIIPAPIASSVNK